MKNPSFLLPQYISSATTGSEFFSLSKKQHEEVGEEN
jgi:hypothetical protein